MLDLLDSLPRLRLSAFSALRSIQARLTSEIGVHTTKHVSSQANEFYANGPSLILVNGRIGVIHSFAPIFAYIPRHPRLYQKCYKQRRRHQKQLTSMILIFSRTCGPTGRRDKFVLVLRWIVENGAVCETYQTLIPEQHKTFRLFDPAIVRVAATELSSNSRDIRVTIGHEITFRHCPRLGSPSASCA